MARFQLHRRPFTKIALFGAVFGVAVTWGCSEDGTTPNCPALLLFDIHDDASISDPDIIANRAEAEKAGCVTTPGDAMSVGGTSSTGGD